MQTYKDLMDLATICFQQSCVVTSQEIAAELKRLAEEYQRRAIARKEAGFRDQAASDATC
jgi:hypothetical protein